MTTTNSPSRRCFLKAAGLTIAGATLTCAGLGVVATRPPAIGLPDRTPEGEQAVNNRILVTYATRAGSTAEIATAIAETLAARGYSASSRDIFGCSKNRQNRIVENSTYPLDDFGFR